MKPLNRTTRLAAALLAAILPLGVSESAAAGARPARPVMKLRVSTHHGYLPLDVTLEGKLAGTGPTAIERCLVSVEWNHTSPGGLKLNSKSKTRCGKWSATNMPAGTHRSRGRSSHPGSSIFIREL